MVLAHVGDSIPQQDRRVQAKTTKSAPRPLFPRIHWWTRYQQGREIHPLAVHPDQPSETERVSTSDSSDGYVQRGSICSLTGIKLMIDPSSVCRGERNDFAKRPSRFGHLVSLTDTLNTPTSLRDLYISLDSSYDFLYNPISPSDNLVSP